VIRFQQVSKAYRGGRQALQKVDFHLKPADMAFLTGHSGAGKSTLLKLICALERPSDGKIWFNGHDITRLPNKQIPFLRRNIGIIFQDHKLLMDRSVFDNIALPLRVEQMTEHDIKRRVSAALDKVGLLDKAKCLPPTGNLDAELSQQVLRLFEEFNRVGVAVLMATHDTSLLASRDYRRLDLHKGNLRELAHGA
jgi:cell division transport system ATP-binding protein